MKHNKQNIWKKNPFGFNFFFKFQFVCFYNNLLDLAILVIRHFFYPSNYLSIGEYLVFVVFFFVWLFPGVLFFIVVIILLIFLVFFFLYSLVLLLLLFFGLLEKIRFSRFHGIFFRWSSKKNNNNKWKNRIYFHRYTRYVKT